MRNRRGLFVGIVAACFAGQALLSHYSLIPSWRKNYAPKQTGIAEGLSPDQLLIALAGFREMVAGILWVRADAFFDTGNYDAILPIVRLVTWLDPNQIDVYATGMWHIGYNFTDEEQRSDRRYLPSALALGNEGIKNNPNTYEMYFETGWMWFHKIDDSYSKAVGYFESAVKQPDMLPARRNLLASAYQRDGQVDKGLEYWFSLLAEAEKRLAGRTDYYNNSQRDTIVGNIDTMLVRMSQRGWFARAQGVTDAAARYDTDPPFDVNFSVRCTVVEPRVLVFEGTWGVLPVGTRIRVILRDKDYPNAIPGSVKWDENGTGVNLDPPRDATYMQDQLYVRNRRFNKKVNMSADPTMYPLTKDKYVIEFYYNPRSSPPHIQDKFSWNGEGLTDKNFLSTEVRPGVRAIYHSFEFTQDELLRRGDWRDKVPVRQTDNFQDANSGTLNNEVVEVPGLLSGQGTSGGMIRTQEKPSSQKP